jgi:hypothetical protein
MEQIEQSSTAYSRYCETHDENGVRLLPFVLFRFEDIFGRHLILPSIVFRGCILLVLLAGILLRFPAFSSL